MCYFIVSNRPLPHSFSVSKHNVTRSRLGWTISHKSLYFVNQSLSQCLCSQECGKGLFKGLPWKICQVSSEKHLDSPFILPYIIWETGGKFESSMRSWIKFFISLNTEGGFGDDGLDGDILGGDEEGGGWDVGDEDLVLPPDLVSHFKNL